MLIRPSIANITKMILVFSVKNPKINISLIDKFLIVAENKHIDVILCFSKTDLDEDKEYRTIANIYKKIGYEVIECSIIDNIGRQELISKIHGDIIVIAGPSGVGKSSLINTLSDNFYQATSNISMKLQKGKNTTTYATLLEFDKDSYIADTPGFSSLKIDDITKEELKDYFIEFDKYSSNCKFKAKCLHELEPSCAVREALEDNLIEKSRYESYIRILNEIKENEKRRKY